MSDEERAYFRQRAEEEIEAAQRAGHPDAARAHYLLAGYYLDLAHNPSTHPSRSAVSADGARMTGEAAFA